MTNWYDTTTMQMGRVLGEDVNAPELRNPRHTAIHSESWIARLMRTLSK